MMNRSVLRGITVRNGDFYANDKLQWILEEIAGNDHDLLISMFNAIVSKGQGFALEFIRRNS